MSALSKSVEELHLNLFGEVPNVIVSAPGRIDLLNTHQDYKGLPVVGVAINLRTYVGASKSSRLKCRAYSTNLNEQDLFSLEELEVRRERKHFGDYMRAGLRALIESGYRVSCFNATIQSEVPIASGLASSAALLVSYISAVLRLSGYEISKGEVAELAFRAANQVMGIPCGRLDQYSSAYGGFLLIRTRPPYGVSEIDFKDGVFVVVDTGIRHSTADIHPKRQEELRRGLAELMSLRLPPEIREYIDYDYYKTDWEKIEISEIEKYLKNIDQALAKRILYTLKAHRSTMFAVKVLKGYSPDLEEIMEMLEVKKPKAEEMISSENLRLRILGEVMTYQHWLLSDLYDVSLPVIDDIVRSALEAGALGAKLSGAGLGGSVVALVDNEDRGKKVLSAMLKAGGSRGWIVKVDEGVVVHRG